MPSDNARSNSLQPKAPFDADAAPMRNDPLALEAVANFDSAGEHEQAVDLLRRLARQGNVAAKSRLGLRLLIGLHAPLEQKEALLLLEDAAALGDADANLQISTLAGGGVLRPQDWGLALDFLLRAAQAGSPRACGQLLLLAGDQSLAAAVASGSQPAEGAWKRLRESVSIESWKQAPPRRPICEAPRIRAADGFVPPAWCDWLIATARGKLKPAMMYDGERRLFTATRNNSDYFFDLLDADLILMLVRERASALMKLPIHAMEPPQILHYAPQQKIDLHYDHLRGEGGAGPERIATFLLYLNDDYGGGDLDFPKASVRITPRRAMAVYFANVDPSGAPDMLTLHASLPVIAGEKWVLSQWIQDRTFGAGGS